LEELGPRAHARGTILLYEFLNRYETNLCVNTAEAVDLVDSVRAPGVRLLCDLFHMNMEEADIAAALRHAGPRVGHVHFADSNRRAAGLGHTDFAPVVAALREIGYAGYLSAEVFAWPAAQQAAEQTIASYRRVTAGP